MKNVCVAGCGASGMMAAISAAETGAKVTVIEKNDRAGKKLFITGKGRCNVTNDCDERNFYSKVVHGSKFLFSAFSGYDAGSVMRFFTEKGCPLKTERGGRVFPVSDKSSDIIKVLTDEISRLGVTVKYGVHVTNVIYEKACAEDSATDMCVKGVELSNGEKIFCDAVIVATGGMSYSSTGSSGDGYFFALDAGHTLESPKPSLVPLTVKEPWCAKLQGLTLKNVRLFADEKNGFDEQGEILFTHFGISGPLTLSASAYYAGGEKKYFIDLKPALDNEQLVKRLERDFTLAGKKQFKNALTKLFPHSLIPIMVQLTAEEETAIKSDTKAVSLSMKQIKAFAALIKKVPLTVTGTRGFDEAVITRGGVNLKEINPSTMESKICSGLYFAGEVMDLDALTGGYNLQIAWSTGRAAGLSCATIERR